jgi:PBSX family phage portal protein
MIKVANIKPFCVVTKQGNTVNTSVLDSYQITGQSKQLESDVFADKYGLYGLQEPLYTPLVMAKLMEMNTYHMRACKVKAGDVSGQGWSLYPLVEKPNDAQKKKTEEFFKRLPEPIENTVEKAQLDKELIGYLSIEIVREYNNFDGPVSLLKHIPAHTVRIHKGGNKFCQLWQGGLGTEERVWFRRLGYGKDMEKVNGVEKASGEYTQEERASELFWDVNYTPRSYFYGIPDITPAIGAITGDISRRDYNIAFFTNYGVPAYMVYITGDFDPGEEDPETKKTPLEEEITKKFQEIVNNPHSVLILCVPKKGGGMEEVTIEIKPLSIEIKEASFRMYRIDNRNEIISAHGIPPYRIGVYETGELAGNLGQESTIIYNESIIKPRQRIYKNLINFYVLPSLGITDWEWELNSIDITDVDKELARVGILIDKAMATPNEGIAFIGDYFGIEVKDDNPAMDLHYYAGQPIDLGGYVPASDITNVLQGMKDKLIEVFIANVTKSSGSDAIRDRKLIKAIADLQKDSSRSNQRRK